MFDDHYAASMALKPLKKRASPGVLFFAVQFVEILFPAWAAFWLDSKRT